MSYGLSFHTLLFLRGEAWLGCTEVALGMIPWAGTGTGVMAGNLLDCC